MQAVLRVSVQLLAQETRKPDWLRRVLHFVCRLLPIAEVRGDEGVRLDTEAVPRSLRESSERTCAVNHDDAERRTLEQQLTLNKKQSANNKNG